MSETTKSVIWSEEDTGCYVDAAYGEDHIMRKVADMLDQVPDERAEALVKELNECPDVCEHADEWLQEATDVLSDYTEPGLVWLWEAGDLILIADPEGE